ncbi:chemotaxis protein CheW [Acetivibrio clariflavus]|uniref:Chemotaxis signal transduction protein n=1 Tax=Acetivibrio clariflavus (strain DSM 19732 / NBRC 101661 / EBR45) TaxID=720554 RepID=G8LWZ8_ACECE|nr:chemotaxis protein CheW [Acetivibrio clariflavus]AEV67650.1 chemotaxis signal transduction protein [Acetivibrio clariflavus DSM 19732]
MEQMLEDMELLEDTHKDKYLTFTLGKEEYGIGIGYVTEIVGIQEITEVPELPHYVKGIINLRGKIIPVIDARLRFGKEEKEYTDRNCTIVIEVKNVTIGLIVDAVAEVLSIDEENVVPLPRLNGYTHHKYIQGIGKVGNNVKLILDCDKLFSDDEMESLSNII